MTTTRTRPKGVNHETEYLKSQTSHLNSKYVHYKDDAFCFRQDTLRASQFSDSSRTVDKINPSLRAFAQVYALNEPVAKADMQENRTLNRIGMSSHLFDTSIVEFVKVKYDLPLVFGGFLGPGLIGPVAAGYIIEKLDMHEIAHVRSQHIPPVAVYIGAKLRHPFRIYSDQSGKIIVMLCEMPIELEGLYEISSVLLDWFERIKAREVVILEGLGVEGVPEEREAVFVADEQRSDFLRSRGISPMESALISGVGGSILNQCLSRRITGLSLLTPVSIQLPDPGAALTIINAVNAIYGLKIATDELEQSAQRLNDQLRKLADQYSKISETAQDKDKRLYG